MTSNKLSYISQSPAGSQPETDHIHYEILRPGNLVIQMGTPVKPQDWMIYVNAYHYEACLWPNP